MKRISLMFIMLSALVAGVAQPTVKVSYVDLTAATIAAEPVLSYEQPEKLAAYKNPMVLYPEIKFQELTGIGGCFNEIGGEALSVLGADEQSAVLKSLFDPASPSSFSQCRVAIGASDFGIDAYSFSEVEGDYKMKHFSLERDKRYMLPFIQKAMAINPDIQIFGSPWSPPGWMKESGFMDRGAEFTQKNQLKDEAKIYKAYALYFAKYVEAYASEGVDVKRIIIQNEQDFHTKYPSCRMPVEQMSLFVRDYMRPLFDKRKLTTEIWAGTFRTADEAEGLRFASSAEYVDLFDGAGLQYTTSTYMADMKSLSPSLKMMHTEGNCFNGLNNRIQAESRFAEVASYINGGCENFCYWNMILNETGKSGWDWRQNALITIDREKRTVIYNPDYATMKLMSQFVRAGAVRVGSFSRHPLISTQLNGVYYLVMQNNLDKPMTYSCRVGDKVVEFEIPAKSLCGVEIEL